MKSATSFISVLALVSVASATVPGCLIAAIKYVACFFSRSLFVRF